MPHLRPRALPPGLALAALLAAALPVCPAGTGQEAAPPAATLDVVAVDRDGRFAEGLGPDDFVVTLDGARRPVLWVRRVSRGPGAATEAASRAATAAAPGLAYAAEPARTVVVVVDQPSIQRGDERDVVQAAGRFLDRLGLNDRVAVVTLPVAPGALLSLSSERAEARAAVARVSGWLAPAPFQAQVEPVTTDTPEQVQMSGLKPQGRIQVDPAPAPTPGAGRAAESLPALRSLFDSLGALPGRKVVTVFSAGLGAATTAQVDEAGRAASSARVLVLAFGARATASGSGLSSAPLERLAAATGGTFTPLGRNPARAVDAAAVGLGACYVVAVATPPDIARAAAPRVKVETTRKGITVRAGQWLAAAADADQVAEDLGAPPPGANEAAAGEAVGRVPDAPRDEPSRPARRARNDELLVALARLFDYADGYERQYSMLVAEEDYKQSASAGGVRLRSDLLLVRPDDGGEWVSFRDVFEVDGEALRDREERLRRLFLDPSPDARARLEAIGAESARYNVGWVERTANVPLLPLSFLRAANRGRFQFELAGREKPDGIEALRIEYTEQARPTLIGDRLHQDVPVFGSFLVDAATGAVIETRMQARRGDSRAEIVVRYRSDPGLGLWVPAEMRESYSQPDIGYSGRSGLVRRAVVEGRATYSNFRRFQVTTGEKVKSEMQKEK